MRTLRRKIQLKDGVEVDTLFTPHLFSYKDEKGLALETDTASFNSVLEAYADIYFLAAINAWELDGKGTADNFPHTRGDFHEYAAANPREFAKDAAEGGSQEEESAAAEQAAPAGKKKAFAWIGRLLRRS